MHPYILRTPIFTLYAENVMIIIAILAAVWLSQRRAAPKGRGYQNMLLDLALWLIPAGIVGARLWEMLFTWGDYVDAPWERLAVWKGGLSVQGALLGGALAAVIFAWRRRARVWELLDTLAPSVVLGQAIGRVGCLLSGDAFGRPAAEVPWFPQGLALVYHPASPAGEIFGSTPLIPAEAMEGAADLLIFAFLMLYRPGREVAGRQVLSYAILCSVARFWLEFLRADSLTLGGLKVAQLLSLVVILAASLALIGRYSGGMTGNGGPAGNRGKTET